MNNGNAINPHEPPANADNKPSGKPNHEAVNVSKQAIQPLPTLLPPSKNKPGAPKPDSNSTPTPANTATPQLAQTPGSGTKSPKSEVIKDQTPPPSERPRTEQVKGDNGNRQQVVLKESVKVDAERLDKIIDLIGELVIAQSMIEQSQAIRDIEDTEVTGCLTMMDKLTRELQEIGTSLRMVPIKGTFQRMARLVRDLSRKLDKPLEFVTQGEDTELDKTVVDAIGDPLVHMIRNAIDHGLEPNVEARQAAGKDPKEKSVYAPIIKADVFTSKSLMMAVVSIEKKFSLKAIDRGIVDESEHLADRDVWMLIFHAGFSTAEQLSDVSGRGVGMDVVSYH